jgi:hypothetical protein
MNYHCNSRGKHWNPWSDTHRKKIQAMYPGFHNLITVRNPLSRLVSFWRFAHRNDPKPRTGLGKWAQLAITFDSFDEWVITVDLTDHYEFGGTALVDYARSMPSIDGVLHQETLSEDWNKWCSTPLVPKRNVSRYEQERPWQDYYTPKTVEIVARSFAEDFEMFGYKAEL